MSVLESEEIEVRAYDGRTLADHLPRLEAYVLRSGRAPLSRHPAWLAVLERGLGHSPHLLEAVRGGETCGFLALAGVRGVLFGSYLVGLPYLNSGGVLADDDLTARLLIDRAVDLADWLDVRHLELRHERLTTHPALGQRLTSKVHMRRALPTTAGALWDALSPKVRNQVRKGQSAGLSVSFGGEERLPDFYEVFSRNMRDLGTPVFGRSLFRAILRQFPDRAEICSVRAGDRPVASALLLHGWGISEVPSASSLRAYNPTCANMLLYWNSLERAIGRGQDSFDFGRSSPDGNTYRFKKQWGALPEPAEWQYCVRRGQVADMRPDNPKYRHFIRIWRKLPVRLTRLIGPPIVRGIP